MQDALAQGVLGLTDATTNEWGYFALSLSLNCLIGFDLLKLLVVLFQMGFVLKYLANRQQLTIFLANTNSDQLDSPLCVARDFVIAVLYLCLSSFKRQFCRISCSLWSH